MLVAVQIVMPEVMRRGQVLVVATQKLLKMLLLTRIRSTPSLLAQGASGMLLTERMGNQVEPHLRSVNRHLAVQAAMLIVMVATGDLVAVLLDLVLMIAEQLAVWTAHLSGLFPRHN